MRTGIDIGSRYTKLAYYAGSNKLTLQKFDTVRFYREYGTATVDGMSISWDRLGLSPNCEIVATGYGRERARLSGATEIPEIKAHVLGAQKMLGIGTFTLADLGGQDVKIIRVESGHIADFHTSDRCAASTGRFLENMARILGISDEELSRHWENPAHLSATCAVFAESELLDMLSRGHSIASLAAGVNYAAVKKFAPMICRFPLDVLIASGGVAMNDAVISLLSNELGISIKVLPEAQFAGAIGCLSMNEITSGSA